MGGYTIPPPPVMLKSPFFSGMCSEDNNAGKFVDVCLGLDC